MTPEALLQFLHKLVEHRLMLSTMIWGPPGIGKSSMVAQTAEEHDLEMIDVRLSQLAPTDLRGLPVADNGVSRWYPPEFLPREGRGILFLDEVNLAPPTMQGMAQQLILDRRVGSYTVPAGWFIWAAGNRKEDRAAVFDMPAPLANRFIHLQVEPHFESFKAYALTQDIHEHLLAFLSFRPGLLHKLDPQQPAWPSPRSWMIANALYKVGLDIAPVVGPDAAAEFISFTALYNQIPDVTHILDGAGEHIAFPGEPSLRYAITVALTMRANAVQQGYNAFQWMAARASAEWVQLFATDLFRLARARNQLGMLAALVQRQVTSTMLRLRMHSPFFATLALFARIQMTDTVPTAATDGRGIYINQRFWAELMPAMRLGLMAHEVLHAALLHVPRRGTREPLLWNIAADIVVNGIILAQAGFELPAGHLRDKELEQLSVEEIYHLLQERRKQYTAFTMADLLWSHGPGRDGYAGLEEYWRQALQRAKTLAETMGHGTQPAGLERELTQMSVAQLDWRAYLWRFMVRTPNDFQGYDRRFIDQRLYLEALEGESVRVYVAVDTSGSIGSKEISLFLGEVVGILRAYLHLVASLYYADAACYGPYPLTEGAEIPRPVGGGGTDFRPFFEAVQKEHEQGNMQDGVCIYLTDGCGTFPEEAPVLPVLWVLSPGGLRADKVPFGETVQLIP